MEPSLTPCYRLLACDLDGTLMGDDIVISERVRHAVARAQDRGIMVTLATGRGFPSTLPYARLLDIRAPIICYQGGLIKHPLTGEVLHRKTMERRLVLEVIELARLHDWHLVVYLDDQIFVKDFRQASSFYANLLGPEIQRVDDLVGLVSESASEPAKFLFVAKDGEADAIEQELTARLGTQIGIVRSHALFVEGNPLGVNKGEALERLSTYLGVAQAQVMAIGDQGNDMPMLEWAGLGVAVANGSAAARSVADWIAPSVAEDGAAVAIERFLLSPRRCRSA